MYNRIVTEGRRGVCGVCEIDTHTNRQRDRKTEKVLEPQDKIL